MPKTTLFQAATHLATAWQRRQLIEYPPSLLPEDRASAYLVQDQMAALIAADPAYAVIGWKVGATSSGVQRAEGYDGPIPGRIFASTLADSPACFAAVDYPEAKIEAEIAFRLTESLAVDQYPFSASLLAEKVVLHPAFDITSTRYSATTKAGWSKEQAMLAGIADNGNGGAIVIGPAVNEWQGFDLMALTIALNINENEAVPNLLGESRGHPFDAFVWTVNTVYKRGFTLQQGDYVLTGSLTEPQPLQAGDEVVACYPDMGKVSLVFV